MKRMFVEVKKISLVALILTVGLSACEKGSNVTPQTLQNVEAAYGSSIQVTGLSSQSLTIQVDKIEDSRCPTNAVCIWMGIAKATLKLTEGTQTADVVLSIPGCSSCNPEIKSKETVSLGSNQYALTLQAISPYPEAGKETPLKDYKVKVQVEKL